MASGSRRTARRGWNRGAGDGSSSVNPGSEMDVLKSEILRKRQLVEDRNLLVVRILGARGALAIEDVCVDSGGGGGREGVVAGTGGNGKGALAGVELTRVPPVPPERPLEAHPPTPPWGVLGSGETPHIWAHFPPSCPLFLGVSVSAPSLPSGVSVFCERAPVLVRSSEGGQVQDYLIKIFHPSCP